MEQDDSPVVAARSVREPRTAAPGRPDLSIGDVAAQTGVGESTLRMWEARYAFPAPKRLPSGHRRYSEQDLARIHAVLRARDEGLPLPYAINRARRLEAEPRPSVYGALREQFPHLHPRQLPKRALVWLSRAIEDECTARAPRPLLFAAFQHERFYREVEPRWREFARSAERAIVLADFPHLRTPADGPAEVPLRESDPLMREWVVACDAPQLSACLVGWERPRTADEPRLFETIWTVEPDVAREAARLCCDLTAQRAPGLVDDLRDRLADTPAAGDQSHLRGAVELATRLLGYAADGAPRE
jgi:MerR family transcriptional regulator, light-induced transcriptional regulator